MSCKQRENSSHTIRPLADTVGFAQYDWQMDSIMKRIGRYQGDLLLNTLDKSNPNQPWKAAICPHDDYSYVGYLYPAVLKNINAKTILLFGVAHKARLMKLEDQIIFDSYNYWKAPYGPVKVSHLREEIIAQLPPGSFQVNDSMQKMEHSLEALIPFLQFFYRNFEIVPVLITSMSFEKMKQIANLLAGAINKTELGRNWKWGEDYAIIISNDAVHYGDEDWGGKNFASYGTDHMGYQLAIQHDQEIMESISGDLDPEKIRDFCNYTVQDTNFREYKWTWCGRYSVPFGLLTAYYLKELQGGNPLRGIPVGHSTSVDHPKLPVEDLRMGVTAPANNHHWVGYAAIGYQ
jgi:AmmeMemoRadiSam system protein B